MKAAAHAGFRILLVVPPFRSVVRPALGVSLLQSALRQHGFDCRTLYANLWFADQLGVHLYETLASHLNLSLGDFLFSCVRFERPRADIERYVDEILLPSGEGRHFRRRSSRQDLIQTVADLARQADRFTEDAADRILREQPRVVGLTSSYQENLASVALARRLKDKVPQVLTVMGGANCGDEMGEELIAQFPELDFVGQGECDHSLIQLATALANGDNTGSVEGILSRENPTPAPFHAAITAEELEQTPFPEFGDYFGQAAALPWRHRFVAGLVMESSRGCWWGARHRCRFCGLNGEQFAFRSKSPARFRAEMESLTRTHGIRRIEMVDNIVDPKYFRDVFPALADSPRIDQFWETSGCLSKSQVQALAQGGTTHIQAGIESLSEKSLRLMNKPTTRLRNIETLKWCRESGIRVLWSHLFGIPGESDDEIGEIAQIAESIHHLDPPFGAHLIRLQRFSPYFESSGEHGFGAVAPAAYYRHLYPFPDASVTRLAFHFDSEFTRERAAGRAFARLRSIASRWRRSHWRSHLAAVNTKHCLLVIDTRPCALRLVTKLTGNERRLYTLCDKALDMAAILKSVGDEMTETEAAASLQFLAERRLMLCIDGRHLSLATHAPARPPGTRAGGDEKMPGGHLLPLSLRDLPGAWRRRTGFRWMLSAYLHREMPLASLKRGNRLASRLLSALVHGAARRAAGSQTPPH